MIVSRVRTAKQLSNSSCAPLACDSEQKTESENSDTPTAQSGHGTQDHARNDRNRNQNVDDDHVEPGRFVRQPPSDPPPASRESPSAGRAGYECVSSEGLGIEFPRKLGVIFFP